MKIVSILTCLVALGACNSTASVPGLPAATGTAGSAMTGEVLASTSNGDPVAITIAGTPIVGIIRNSIHDRGGFRAFSSYTASGGNIVFSSVGHSSETSNGDMTASVAATSANSPYGFRQAATFSRVTPTVLPTSGTADFSGQYIGSHGGQFFELNRVTGNVALSADFDASTISGSISNRYVDGPFVQYSTSADVALGAATIDGTGAFSGTATGGNLAAQPFNFVSGNWSGLIGGATGNQAAGAVQITHQHFPTGATTIETGVFLAD